LKATAKATTTTPTPTIKKNFFFNVPPAGKSINEKKNLAGGQFSPE
jgi:hypothetical protein